MSDDPKAFCGNDAKSALGTADPPRNFTLPAGDRIRALTIGVPAYAARKRQVEDLEDAYVRTLVAAADAVRSKRGENGEAPGDAIVAQALIDRVRALDLRRINRLIATHNQYYPIEANLPIDPRSGAYLSHGRRWCPEEPCTAERLLDRARTVLHTRPTR